LKWLLIIGIYTVLSVGCAQSEPFDWKQDWWVTESFKASIDTTGFDLPSAIAFVPDPGSDPKDVLYFVAELGGKVKVVTNDRTVSEFAEVPVIISVLPTGIPDGGLAGICLSPEHGYVFVTYASSNSAGVVRNNIIRFETEETIFGLRSMNTAVVGHALADEFSAISHQVGGCQVDDGLLYVGVGDGYIPPESQAIDSLLGKVVRMTLDGEPVTGNPFYEAEALGLDDDARYVWAYGLRNPFGLEMVSSQLFVVDNGGQIDRFLRVEKGKNYKWDGTDLSIGSSADAVFSPAVGPVQLEFYPEGSTLFPEEYRSGFYFAASSAKSDVAGIMAVPYDMERSEVSHTPSRFVKYKGNILSGVGVVSLAFGPDGLYAASILPNRAGESHIVKIAYDPGGDYPYILRGTDTDLVVIKGCRGCHIIGDTSGQVGPELDFVSGQNADLQSRLNSSSYRSQLARLDLIAEEPFVSTRQARREVLESKGVEQLKLYIKNKVLEPRFDNQFAVMPKLGLTLREASIVADELTRGSAIPLYKQIGTRFRSWTPFPETRSGDIVTGVFYGFVAAVGSMLAVLAIIALWRRLRR